LNIPLTKKSFGLTIDSRDSAPNYENQSADCHSKKHAMGKRCELAVRLMESIVGQPSR